MVGIHVLAWASSSVTHCRRVRSKRFIGNLFEVWRERVFLFAFKEGRGVPQRLMQAQSFYQPVCQSNSWDMFWFKIAGGQAPSECARDRGRVQCAVESHGTLTCLDLAYSGATGSCQGTVENSWKCCDASLWPTGHAPNAPPPFEVRQSCLVQFCFDVGPSKEHEPYSSVSQFGDVVGAWAAFICYNDLWLLISLHGRFWWKFDLQIHWLECFKCFTAKCMAVESFPQLGQRQPLRMVLLARFWSPFFDTWMGQWVEQSSHSIHVHLTVTTCLCSAAIFWFASGCGWKVAYVLRMPRRIPDIPIMGWQAAAYCRGECWGGNSGFPDDADAHSANEDDGKCDVNETDYDDDDDDVVLVVEPQHDSQLTQVPAGLIVMVAFFFCGSLK